MVGPHYPYDGNNTDVDTSSGNDYTRIEYTWHQGDSQVFEVGEEFEEDNFDVFVNGVWLFRSQYNLYAQDQEFEILDQLENNDKIGIKYYKKG